MWDAFVGTKIGLLTYRLALGYLVFEFVRGLLRWLII
jgi:hypothetical protein